MGTFAWMRAKQSDIIVLNDFRWSASIIPCSDFQQMLERDIVHLPAPKRHWIHKGHAILGHGRHSISLSKGCVHWSDQHSNDVSLLAILSLLEANSRKGSSMSHSLSEMFWETYYRYQMKPPHIFLSFLLFWNSIRGALWTWTICIFWQFPDSLMAWLSFFAIAEP